MINTGIYLILMFMILLVPLDGFAQFINLQIEIEPELSAAVEQDLDFGNQITNSGPSIIELGDVGMGIFSIRAFNNQMVYVELRHDDYLINSNPAISDRIPFDIGITYNNSGENSYRDSILLPGKSGMVKLAGGEVTGSDAKIWSALYLYVYGSINIGNVSNGLYTTDIVLTITYQ